MAADSSDGLMLASSNVEDDTSRQLQHSHYSNGMPSLAASTHSQHWLGLRAEGPCGMI